MRDATSPTRSQRDRKTAWLGPYAVLIMAKDMHEVFQASQLEREWKVSSNKYSASDLKQWVFYRMSYVMKECGVSWGRLRE